MSDIISRIIIILLSYICEVKVQVQMLNPGK